jgi:hypothetical protein
MTPRGPSGSPPPAEAQIAGVTTSLAPVADAICERYRDEYPDEIERYGDAGIEWCRHDNQWLLSWASGDVLGVTDLCEQACWLARVLHARDFPVDRLARDLQIAAEVVAQGAFGEASAAVAERLAVAAETVYALDLG